MNGAQIHLLLNHVPVFVPFIGLGVFFFGAYRKSRDVQLVGLGLLFLGALGTVPAYVSGDEAEDAIRQLPFFRKEAVHEHEQAAAFALAAVELIAVVGAYVFSLLVRGRDVARGWVIFLAVLGLWGFSVVARTSHLGGLVHHEELSQAGK